MRDNYQIVSYAEEIRDAASIQKANGRPRKNALKNKTENKLNND